VTFNSYYCIHINVRRSINTQLTILSILIIVFAPERITDERFASASPFNSYYCIPDLYVPFTGYYNITFQFLLLYSIPYWVIYTFIVMWLVSFNSYYCIPYWCGICKFWRRENSFNSYYCIR